jgi:hypothetical protein
MLAKHAQQGLEAHERERAPGYLYQTSPRTCFEAQFQL